MSCFIRLIIMIFEYNYVKIILIRLSTNYLYGPKCCCISKLSLNEEIKISKIWIAARESNNAERESNNARHLAWKDSKMQSPLFPLIRWHEHLVGLRLHICMFYYLRLSQG